MSVQFYVADGSSLQLTVTRPQAVAILAALGEDVADDPGPAGVPGGPFRGRLSAGPLLDRLAAFNRQLISNRIREFTAPALNRDALVRCMLAVKTLAERAAAAGRDVQFHEAES